MIIYRKKNFSQRRKAAKEKKGKFNKKWNTDLRGLDGFSRIKNYLLIVTKNL